MTYFIRGQERLVFETTKQYLIAQLTALGWYGDVLPFGAAEPGPITLQEFIPQNVTKVAPNTIAFTSGIDDIDAPQELGASGGGLWKTNHVFFIDIWMESQGLAKQMASDIRAILTGRLPGCSRVQQLTDFTQDPAAPATGHYLQYEDVETTTPENQDEKRNWRVVKVTCEHYYNASEYGGV